MSKTEVNQAAELTETDLIKAGDKIINPLTSELLEIGSQHYGKTASQFRNDVHVDFKIVREGQP